MHLSFRWTVPVLISAALLAGCSHREVMQPNIEATIGQQLIDLKKAQDFGALNDSEYQRQKRHLIDNMR